MQSIRLSLVLQVVLAALTLGACLGAILPRLPDLAAIRAEPASPPPSPAAVALGATNTSGAAANSAANAAAGGGIADAPAGGASLQVQVRAEVQAAGNANAEAQALGPGNTQAKANTLGPGSGQAVAYSTDPNRVGVPQVPAQTSQANLPSPGTSTVPAGFSNSPSLTVREAIVNVCNGPSTQNTIVGMATQGQQFTPVGRTLDGSWWKICCYDSQLVWVAGALMDARGPLDNIEVINVAAQPAAPVAAAPTAIPTPPTAAAAPPAPTYEFSLVEKNQFAETITPRIYLYIAQGAAGLNGYTLRVKKDNVYLPVNVDSFDGQPAITWPLPIDRQRFYNLKVEFPGIAPAGTWEVQAIEDGTGRAVSAPVVFTLVPNDPRQEMYISLRR
jgi:hypothetical protein